MMAKFKEYMGKVKDFIKGNFHKYFWYFVAFLAGIITGGLFI